MLYYLKSLPEKFYRFWVQFVNLKNKTSILPIDFTKSWRKIIWDQKKAFSLAFFSESTSQIFYTLVPIFIGKIVESQQYTYFVVFIIGWILATGLEFISKYYGTVLEVQCINSVEYNAYEFFLTVDPVYHATKESGKLYAKIERAARAYEEFLDILLLEVVPTLISVFTVVASFIWFDFELGIISLLLLLIVGSFNIVANIFLNKAFEKNIIAISDDLKTVSVENLTQMQLIRASFATGQATKQIKHKNHELMYKMGSAWLAFGFINRIVTRGLYVLTVYLLGVRILDLVQAQVITVTIGVTLLLAYLRGTYEVVKLGARTRKALSSVTRIKDLYKFIKHFGKQTFPVLALSEKTLESQLQESLDLSSIKLEVLDLTFDYNPKAKIFENHNLSIEIGKSQSNKLYGIIGPSGMGKTTLISILGGQLRPSHGTVKINGIPLYSIDDESRRKILAVQGQVASSLSGTLRKNLLIGLPKEQIYSDSELIEILKEVGIWPIFEEKLGLDSQIGESGLTLSGGQRQRLNFASLYLRAKYYKPLLILIDEPTSSLDEMSERAITDMISKLAEEALTFVIAHRLKTLEDAVGILDFTLIEEYKDIKFYPKEQLENLSLYYKNLLEGQINIDKDNCNL